MSVLQQYIDFKGWQGGTIHQAKEDFKSLSIEDKDRFCGRLNQILYMLSTASDLSAAQWFMEERNNYLEYGK